MPQSACKPFYYQKVVRPQGDKIPGERRPSAFGGRRRRGVARLYDQPRFLTTQASRCAALAAIGQGRRQVLAVDVRAGIDRAITQADQSKRDMYHKASTGTKSDNMWKEVVAACALASADERGYFSSRAVQEALSVLINRTVIQQAVAYHLGKLIEMDRGPLLERVGQERRYRYRFTDPLMRPFIVLQAMKDGLIEG